MNDNNECNCGLCVARRENRHPWESMWGVDSIEAKLLRAKPGKPVHAYEDSARIIRAYHKSPAEQDEAVRAWVERN